MKFTIKILHIISDLGPGGAPAVLANLTSEDPVDQHVVISMMTRDVFGAEMQKRGVDVHELGMPRGKLPLSKLFHMFQLVRAIKPDVVQTWMYHSDLIGGIIAKLAGYGAIVWGIHNSDLSPARTPRKSIIAAKICSKVDFILPRKIISCSDLSARIHLAQGYSEEKMVTVYNGYNMEKFYVDKNARNLARAELNVSEDTWLLGMVARWHPVKDHENLMASLSHTLNFKKDGLKPNWRLALMGEGMTSENSDLNQLIAKYGLDNNVLLLGARKNIAADINALDLHILSSAGEAFPNSVAESMACGVPCVSTDVGDARLILNDDRRVAPKESPEALASVIDQLVADIEIIYSEKELDKLRDQLHQSIASRFSTEAMLAGYRCVWREAAVV